MDCSNNEHRWTARFYTRGALAFWFCSCCGEVDREIDSLSEPLENAVSVDESSTVSFCSRRFPAPTGKWALADGSILIEGEPGLTTFMGYKINGIKDSHEYSLADPGGEIVREYKAGREKASNLEGSFILTRFQVENDQLIKYRVQCNVSEPQVNEASEIAILSGLKLLQV
ncbi:MAG: hypothetical protein KAH31_09015 [Candidatus Sabulitectum sp.]|nr:hypothetical protein [Candidatus Sabulitectum sp.]